MTIKDQYLGELNHLLHVIPSEQRQELLLDYELHFQMAMENGQPEEQIAHELGDPRVIAKELLLGYRVHQAETKQSPVRVSRAVFSAVSLGFFNLIFMLGPYLALMGILFSLWVVVVVLWATPVLLLADWAINETFPLTAVLSVCALIAGLALLAGVGMTKLTKGLLSMTMKYLKWNTRVVRVVKEK